MMQELDEITLKRLIRQLDEGVPREGAIVLENSGGSYGDASRVVTANRRGYLRLGVEYLKAAFAAPRSEVQPHRVDVDLSYIDGSFGSEEPYAFERREDAASVSPEADGGNVVVRAILGAIALFSFACLVVGLVTIVDKALGLLLGRY
jgi:hypothetical protein